MLMSVLPAVLIRRCECRSDGTYVEVTHNDHLPPGKERESSLAHIEQCTCEDVSLLHLQLNTYGLCPILKKGVNDDDDDGIIDKIAYPRFGVISLRNRY